MGHLFDTQGNIWFTQGSKTMSLPLIRWNDFISEAGYVGATLDNEYDIECYKFAVASNNALKATFTVPVDNTGGFRWFAKIRFYTPSIVGNVKFSLISRLVRSGTDAMNSTANQYAPTVTEQAVNGTANVISTFDIPLTDAAGQINSLDVTGDASVHLLLFRDTATSDDTADVRVSPYVQIYRN